MQNAVTDSKSIIDDSRLELLFIFAHLIPKMVWLSDLNGNRFFFSHKWLHFTGMKIEDAQGNGWLRCVHDADRSRLLLNTKSAMSTKQSFHLEYRLRKKDGTYRQVLESGAPAYRENGSLSGYIGTCTDIHESAQSGNNLPKQLESPNSNDQIRTLQNLPVGVWQLDSQFRIEHVNQIVYDQIGYDESIAGRKIGEFVPSLSEELLANVVESNRILQMDGTSFSYADRNEEKPSRLAVTVVPVRGSGEASLGLCVCTVQQKVDSERSRKMKEVIGALVHDLKSPLVGAERTFAALLNGQIGQMDDDLAKIVKILQRSNRSMLEMIQNLIELHRNESEGRPLLREPTDLFEIARTTLMELSVLAEERGIFLIDALPETPGILSAESVSLKRVMHNLVSNAIKFTNAGGSIRLSAELSDAKLVISVSDTGTGISSDDQKHLFKRHFQGQRGRRQTDGSGLGLFLCKTIVENHGGQILVKSEEGNGSVFTLVFPKC